MAPDQVYAQQGRVVLATARHLQHAAGHHVRIEDDVRGHVDRVVERRIRRQPLFERMPKLRRWRRHVEAGIDRRIGHQHTGAAGMAQHRHAPSTAVVRNLRVCDEHLQVVRQRLDAIRAHHAVRGKDGVVDLVGAGQRPGMGGNRTPADVGCAHFDQDDGLARLKRAARNAPELRAIAHAFDVSGDHRHAGIVDEVIAEIAEFEVGLVAGTQRNSRSRCAARARAR